MKRGATLVPMPVSRFFQPVADLAFPPRCPLCGAAISGQTGLCAACWSTLAIPGEPACARCQRPFPDPAGAEVCAPCLADPPDHDGIAAATLYNDASRRLVLNFKHGNRIALAGLMARLIAAKLPDVGSDWLLVPVPLHRWRLWRRGYNQSALLAHEIGRLTGAPVCVDALIRLRRTPPLGGLGALARRRILAGAIALAPGKEAQISGRPVLLVDDVLTSGATSEACVSILRQTGARAVRIACFARVLEKNGEC